MSREAGSLGHGMGRLYWKFFSFFWLAQLVTSIGVGVTIWLLRPDGQVVPPPPLVMPAQIAARVAPGAQGPLTEEAGRAPRWVTPPLGDGEPLPPPDPPGVIPPWMPPLMPLVAGSLVSLLFAAMLAWYFARPIRKLRGAFEAVAAGRMETRIGDALAGRDDELASLGQDFDRMVERLQDLLDGRQRLMHDVSHELRSPLARLQAAADLVRMRPERVERETVRMDHLVGELLTLARLDAGMANEGVEDFYVADLVVRIAEDAALEGRARDCRVVTAVNEGLQLKGHPELLHRMVENVVRNAVRHSPRGGEVCIEVGADARLGSVIIEVMDAGPGVPEEDLERIFQPFRRGDATKAEGYGLGLAITRRVAEAHGGSVYAANRPGGGLTVSIILPGDTAPQAAPAD